LNALGIDVGGSGFRTGVFNLDSGELVGELERFTHGDSTEPEAVLSAIRTVLDTIGWQGPIGMGFPGAVVDGRPITAPNLGDAWIGYDVGASLEPYHGGRFSLINDADAVAVAECYHGAGHGNAACVLTLTVGTGLGTTLHQNGTLVPNLEYGRWPHPTRPGCLEEHLSGQARRIEGLSLEAWAGRFQEGLVHLEASLEPDRIILYGGLMEHWDTIRPLLSTRAELVPASLLETAGPLGAALATQPL